MKPYSSALCARAPFQSGDASAWIRLSASSTRPAAPVMSSPTRQSITQRMTSTPRSSSRFPATWITRREKKPASAVASPSMRSISSPGVCFLWKEGSSPRQCRSSAARSAFVAVQPIFSLRYGRPYRCRLLDQRDQEEQPGGERQGPVGGAVRGTVNEPPHDLRVQELEPDASQEEQRERADPPPLRSETERLPELAPLPPALLPDCFPHHPLSSPGARRQASSREAARRSSLSRWVSLMISAAWRRQRRCRALARQVAP